MSERWFPDQMPMPAANAETIAFWEAAAQHHLVIQRCQDCGVTRHPPSPRCARCRSERSEWQELPGTGSVYTFSVVRQAFIPALADQLPYVVCAVELDEAGGARMMSNIVGCPASEVTIGMSVRLVWEDMGPHLTLPRFTPTEKTATP